MNSKTRTLVRKLREHEQIAWLGANIEERRLARRALIRLTRKYPEIAETLAVQVPTPEEIKIGPTPYLANGLGLISLT